MPTKYKTLLIVALATAIFAAKSFAAEAAEGGKSLISKDLSGWKVKDPKNTTTWKIVSEVKLDPADPKKLVGTGDGSDNPVLFRSPTAHGSDILTEADFGDCELHVEFVVPKGANSGVYLQGRYEVQVFDSFGRPDDKVGTGDVGAVYNTAKPTSNASKPPGEWQSFDIIFQAPKFENGKKTQNAKFISVKLNGKEIQSNVEAKAPTGGQISDQEVPKGPLLFQGDHGIVAFRSVRIKEKE